MQNMSDSWRWYAKWKEAIHKRFAAAAAAKSLQSCPTLSDPMDYSPPGSSVHGLSRGARAVRSLCTWWEGACHCSRVMVGELGLKTSSAHRFQQLILTVNSLNFWLLPQENFWEWLGDVSQALTKPFLAVSTIHHWHPLYTTMSEGLWGFPLAMRLESQKVQASSIPLLP